MASSRAVANGSEVGMVSQLSARLAPGASPGRPGSVAAGQHVLVSGQTRAGGLAGIASASGCVVQAASRCMRAGASVNEVEVVPLPPRIDAMHRKLTANAREVVPWSPKMGVCASKNAACAFEGASWSRPAVAITSKYGTFALEVVACAWKDRACATRGPACTSKDRACAPEGLACASEDLACALKGQACATNARPCAVRDSACAVKRLGVCIEGAHVRIAEHPDRAQWLVVRRLCPCVRSGWRRIRSRWPGEAPAEACPGAAVSRFAADSRLIE